MKKIFVSFNLVFALIFSSCFLVNQNENNLDEYWANYNKELTGYKFNFKSTIYEYSTDYSLTGDGYSLKIYELPDSAAEYFKNPPEKFFKSFPINNEENRKIYKWKKTPISEADIEVYEIVYPDFDTRTASKIDSILNNQASYYSAICLMHNYEGEENIRSVNFYIISNKLKQIIFINNNR